MVTWGVIRLVRALIDWRARIRYEEVRAASVASILRSVPAGAIVEEGRRDGTLLRIEIPARQVQEGSGRDMAERPVC